MFDHDLPNRWAWAEHVALESFWLEAWGSVLKDHPTVLPCCTSREFPVGTVGHDEEGSQLYAARWLAEVIAEIENRGYWNGRRRAHMTDCDVAIWERTGRAHLLSHVMEKLANLAQEDGEHYIEALWRLGRQDAVASCVRDMLRDIVVTD